MMDSSGTFAVRVGLLLLGGSISGCAGPMTPLGGVRAITPEQARGEASQVLQQWAEERPIWAAMEGGPRISITPSRQVLHGRASMKLTIEDKNSEPDAYHLFIRHNGLDVTESFLAQSQIRFQPEKGLTIENRGVRLPASDEHRIEFIYLNTKGRLAYNRYEAPSCEAFRARPLLHVGEFKAPLQLVQTIDQVSRAQGISPAFLAALVAQESSFNPHQVSWAKAIGLTQVTSIAEREIAGSYADWPRYPGIEEMNVAQVKYLVMNGKINGDNEWRLDHAKSVEGGGSFVRALGDRWNLPENAEKIRTLPGEFTVVRTRLILASYHSGFARVMGAVRTHGADWMQAPQLKEAKKYVNRVFSYCNYFADEGVLHANAS